MWQNVLQRVALFKLFTNSLLFWLVFTFTFSLELTNSKTKITQNWHSNTLCGLPNHMCRVEFNWGSFRTDIQPTQEILFHEHILVNFNQNSFMYNTYNLWEKIYFLKVLFLIKIEKSGLVCPTKSAKTQKYWVYHHLRLNSNCNFIETSWKMGWLHSEIFFQEHILVNRTKILAVPDTSFAFNIFGQKWFWTSV